MVRQLQADLAFSNLVIKQQLFKIEFLIQHIKQNELQNAINQHRINQLEQSVVSLNNIIHQTNERHAPVPHASPVPNEPIHDPK